MLRSSKNEIPGSYVQQTVERLELHMFGDDSEDVFSRQLLLRIRFVTAGIDKINLLFLFRKTWVALLKSLTFPKLELQPDLLASQLPQMYNVQFQKLSNEASHGLTKWSYYNGCNRLKKKPVFVADWVTGNLKLTTFNEQNHVPTADNITNVGARGSSASSSFDSSCLRGSDVLRWSNWLFDPCFDVITKIRSRKHSPETEMLQKETHEMMTLTAHVSSPESTFEWLKYNFYEKSLWRICYVFSRSSKVN